MLRTWQIYIKDSDYKEPLTVIHVKIVNEQVITRIHKQLNINYKLQQKLIDVILYKILMKKLIKKAENFIQNWLLEVLCTELQEN